MTTIEPLDGPLREARAGQSFRRFWRKWRRFDDRASLSEMLWMWVLLSVVALPFVALSTTLMFVLPPEPGAPDGAIPRLALLPMAVFWLVALVPWIALLSRRMRDVGLTPWLLLAFVLPLVQLLPTIALLLPADTFGPRSRAGAASSEPVPPPVA